MEIFPDEFVPNIEGSSYHPKWVRSNPAEDAKWRAFRDAVVAYEAGNKLVPPTMATKYGKALVAAGKEHMSVTDIGADYTPPVENPPPPTGGTPILDEHWEDLSAPPWSAMFTYTGNPALGTGVQSSGDGSMTIVTAPDGVGKALRTLLRDDQPGWPPNPATDRSHLTSTTTAAFGGPIAVGDVYYFDFELWLPLNNPAGDYFDYPRAQYYRLWEPHENTGTRWSCFTLVSDGLPANNAWMPLRLASGDYSNPSPILYFPLFQLTNSDGSWHTQNFNRRLHIRYGGRFAPDSSGWFEAYVDGGLVIPRTNHPTMWAGDYNQYMAIGQYKAHGDLFPHYGKSVVYYLKTTVESVP